MLAVNKPPRLASVPATEIRLEQTVLGMVAHMCGGRGFVPYLLHRLDMQTSGVLLFGKYPRDRAALENIFRKTDTEKTYVGLLKGIPRGNELATKLPARTADILVAAQTTFKVIKVYKGPFGVPCALVSCKISTGRKHQIRQHFAQAGCPVIMDSQYGDARFNKAFWHEYHLSRQFLHAASIAFTHPLLEKRVVIEAPLPPDLAVVLKQMK